MAAPNLDHPHGTCERWWRREVDDLEPVSDLERQRRRRESERMEREERER